MLSRVSCVCLGMLAMSAKSQQEDMLVKFNQKQIKALEFYLKEFDSWEDRQKVGEERKRRAKKIQELVSSPKKIDSLTPPEVRTIETSLWAFQSRYGKFIANENDYGAIKRTLTYLLFADEDIFERAYKVSKDPHYKLKGLGESKISELLFKAKPNPEIALVNERSKNLAQRMGFDFELKKFSDKLRAYDGFVKTVQKVTGIKNLDDVDFLLYFIDNTKFENDPLPKTKKSKVENFSFTQEDFDRVTGKRQDALYLSKRIRALEKSIVQNLDVKYANWSHYPSKPNKRGSKGQTKYWKGAWTGFVHPDALIKRPQESVQIQTALSKEYLSTTIYISFVGRKQLKKVMQLIKENKNTFLEILQNLPPDYYIGVNFRKDSTEIYSKLGEITEQKLDKIIQSMSKSNIDFYLGQYWENPKDVIARKENVVDDITGTFESLLPVYRYLTELDTTIVVPKDSAKSMHGDEFSRYEDVLKNKKQIIFYGPPGTGKTYQAMKFAKKFVSKNSKSLSEDEIKKRLKIVTFHQSFSYEEFVEGIKAKIIDEKLIYEIEDGIFKEICKDAQKESGNFVLVIDEINRGNITKIFGELISLIENDKRKGAQNEITVSLPYSKKQFSIPPNVYIIGTMNTADRSIIQVDTALRRRFGFVEFLPLPEKLKNVDDISLSLLLTNLNKMILEYGGDRERRVGHSYFMKNGESILEFSDLKFTFETEVIPLVQEYFYHDYNELKNVLGEGFVDVVNQQIKKNLSNEDFRAALKHILNYEKHAD